LGADIYIEEDEDWLNGDEAETDALTQILQEIEQQTQLNLAETVPDAREFTVKDLLMALLSRFDKDQKLTDVKLSDLVAVILEMQEPKDKP